MDLLGILGIFCGSASLAGILLSLNYFFSKNSRNSMAAMMLGILFLAISMRLAKSIWHYIFYDYSKLGVVQGFLAMTIIGPALLGYILSSTRKDSKWFYVHWVWTLIGVIIAWLQPISYRFLYMYGTALVMLYVGIASVYHFRTSYDTPARQTFNRTILAGVFLIACSLVFQHVMGGVLYYTYGAAFASLVIFYLLFQTLSKSLISHSTEGESVPEDTLQKVKQAIENDKLYLKSGLTVSQFSHDLDIPAYLLKRSVNKLYQKSFPETINHFRVKEVKQRLENGDSKRLKIEGIANEAGFATPSAFYSAFKKETGQTPSQFQNSIK